MTPEDHLNHLEPACSRCMENGGLCTSCAMFDRSILPQLAVPAYVKLIVKRPPNPAPRHTADPEAERIRDRKARKRAKTAARLARAIAGARTRSPNAPSALDSSTSRAVA